MTIYEMLSGTKPWKYHTSDEIVTNAVNGNRPYVSSKWNKELSNIMKLCWSQLPGINNSILSLIFYTNISIYPVL
jgi:hypothetical protein